MRGGSGHSIDGRRSVFLFSVGIQLPGSGWLAARGNALIARSQLQRICCEPARRLHAATPDSAQATRVCSVVLDA